MSSEEPSLGDLVARVVREAQELASAELDRARAEFDERARHGARLALRAGITLTLSAVALQAFAIAAIIWSGRIFGGYVAGAVVVGSVFLALATVGGLSARRAVLDLADPVRNTDGPQLIDGAAPRALPERIDEEQR